MFSNTTGNFNTHIWLHCALSSNRSGSLNVAIGAGALHDDTSSNNTSGHWWQCAVQHLKPPGSPFPVPFGHFNVAVGSKAYFQMLMGIRNTAVGFYHASCHLAGDNNTAIGAFHWKIIRAAIIIRLWDLYSFAPIIQQVQESGCRI